MVRLRLRSRRLVPRSRQAPSRKNGGSLSCQRPARGRETWSDPNRESTKCETNCRDLPARHERLDRLLAAKQRATGTTIPPGGLDMTISRNEEWVQIARLDDSDRIHFTQEFQSI